MIGGTAYTAKNNCRGFIFRHCNTYKYLTGSNARARYNLNPKYLEGFTSQYGKYYHDFSHEGKPALYRLAFERPEASSQYGPEKYEIYARQCFTTQSCVVEDDGPRTLIATYNAPNPTVKGWRVFNEPFVVNEWKALIWVEVSKRYPHDGKRLGLDGIKLQYAPQPMSWSDIFRDSINGCSMNGMQNLSDAVWNTMALSCGW